MTEIAQQLKDDVLRLSEEDRVEPARVLWDSIPGPDDGADIDNSAQWIAELERRSADVDAGRATEQPFRETIEELRGERP